MKISKVLFCQILQNKVYQNWPSIGYFDYLFNFMHSNICNLITCLGCQRSFDFLMIELKPYKFASLVPRVCVCGEVSNNINYWLMCLSQNLPYIKPPTIPRKSCFSLCSQNKREGKNWYTLSFLDTLYPCGVTKA